MQSIYLAWKDKLLRIEDEMTALHILHFSKVRKLLAVAAFDNGLGREVHHIVEDEHKDGVLVEWNERTPFLELNTLVLFISVAIKH